MAEAGNIFIGLAVVTFLLLLGSFRLAHGAGDISAAILLPLVMFIVFSLAFCSATAGGTFDWLGWTRDAQYMIVVACCLSLMTVVGFAAMLRGSPLQDIPFVLRPFVPWAAPVMPATLIVLAFLLVNRSLFPLLPGAVLQMVIATVGGVALLTGVAMLGQGYLYVQSRQLAKLDREVEFHQQRDRNIMEGVKAADPAKDFGSLLYQSSRFETAGIRVLALQKILSNGDNFTTLMTASLRNCYYSGALTFLRDNDAPNPAPLAEPVRDALLLLAHNVKDLMRTEYNIRPTDFESDTDSLLTVAGKFAPYGVDYQPAIREFRAALDAPREPKVQLYCRETIDRWLAKNHPPM